MLDKISLFGIGITNASKEEVLECIENSLKKKRAKYYIVTPNPELVMIAQKSPSYKNILNNADLALCDGFGLLQASRFLGKPIKERITGAGFMLELCHWFAKKPITVGFLGGRPGVAEKVSECLLREFPDLKVSFAASEISELIGKPEGLYYVSRSMYQGKEKIHNTKYPLRQSVSEASIIPNTDILFVAFGSPKQEEWIAQNLESLSVKVVMGVGGAFDFISGTVPRAPHLVRSLGLEWLYRLIRQPWRAKRQLALLQFVTLVLREKIRQ